MLEPLRQLAPETEPWPVAEKPRHRAIGGWELSPGARVAPGRTIVRRLGGGVQHEVFLVDDVSFGRCVAKLARPATVARGDACGVLVHEATALAHLAGPGVVRCLDVVLRGRHPHLLLEYVPGPTLRHVLRARRTLSAPAVASLGASLALTVPGLAERGWV